jgi:hypothetical protein
MWSAYLEPELMPTAPMDKPRKVVIDGDVVGELLAAFEDSEDLVEALRERTAYIGLSYGLLDAIAGLPEGGTGKYLSPLRVRQLTMNSMLKLTNALGLKPLLVVDAELVRKVQPKWEKRDERKINARRPPSLGQTQLKRLLKPIAAELGRRGHLARMKGTTPEQRRAIGQRGAMARWRNKEF